MQHVALWAAAIVTAAAVLGIAYLLGSDVRGRAEVAAETVRARASVAAEVIRAAQQAHARSANPNAPAAAVQDNDQMACLHQVRVEKAATNETGWRGIALSSNCNGRIRYLIVKGTAHEWVDAHTVRVSQLPPAGMT